MVVEPSQGTHFFHNITSQGVAYFTVGKRVDSTIDWGWVNGLEPTEQTEWINHYELVDPLDVLIDGQKGAGMVLKGPRPA
jgi:hypothetical protein